MNLDKQKPGYVDGTQETLSLQDCLSGTTYLVLNKIQLSRIIITFVH